MRPATTATAATRRSTSSTTPIREAWVEKFAARYHVRHSVTERRNQDGRWFQATNMRTDDGTFIGVRADITELKEREKALRRSMRKIELFRHVLDELPVAAFIKSDDLTIEFVNKAWTDLTGIAKEEAIGHTDRDLFGARGRWASPTATPASAEPAKA